jgi:hypothetical protein
VQYSFVLYHFRMVKVKYIHVQYSKVKFSKVVSSKYCKYREIPYCTITYSTLRLSAFERLNLMERKHNVNREDAYRIRPGANLAGFLREIQSLECVSLVPVAASVASHRPIFGCSSR